MPARSCRQSDFIRNFLHVHKSFNPSFSSLLSFDLLLMISNKEPGISAVSSSLQEACNQTAKEGSGRDVCRHLSIGGVINKYDARIARDSIINFRTQQEKVIKGPEGATF